MHCQICDYCETTNNSLDQLNLGSIGVRVRYNRKTGKDICDICIGFERVNLRRYETEQQDKEYFDKIENARRTAGPKNYEHSLLQEDTEPIDIPEEERAKLAGGHYVVSDAPTMSEV